MVLGQKLQYMKLLFTYFAVLQVVVNASDAHLSFTCGAHGIKLHTNDSETLGGTPTVDMTCPKVPIKTDAHTAIACKVLSKTFAKITWFHNAQPISEQRKSHVRVDRKSCDQTLKIKFAMASDGGNYTCQVANGNATVNKTCFLDVKAPPKDVQVGYVKIAGNRQKAILQGSVVLKCIMLHAQVGVWLRNSEKITHNERQVYRREHLFGAKVMLLYLKIVNVTKNDEGMYTCLASSNGRQANKTFHLETEPCPSGYICTHEGNTAVPSPRSSRAHATKEVQVGYVKIAGNRQKAILQGSVMLKCSMLHAQVGVWLRNSENITHNERQVYRRERMFGSKVMMLYLKIVNVTKNDEGLYTCLASRNERQAKKTFHLETEPCPSGYICSHEGNTAVPSPYSSRGSCSVFQGYMLMFVYIPMALYGCLVCPW